MSKGRYDKLLTKYNEALVQIQKYAAENLSLRSKLSEPQPNRESKWHRFYNSPGWGVGVGVLLGVIVMGVSSHSRAANFVIAGGFLFFWAVLCFEFIRLKVTSGKRKLILIDSAFCVVLLILVAAGWEGMPKVTDQPDPVAELRNTAPWIFDRPSSSTAPAPPPLQAQILKPDEHTHPQTSPMLTIEILRIMAPATVKQMDGIEADWDRADREIDKLVLRKDASLSQGVKDLSELGRDLDAARAFYNPQRQSMNSQYTSQVVPLLKDAESIRQELLRGQIRTNDDQKYDAIFNKVMGGKSINWSEFRQLTMYMDQLVTRFFPPAK